VTDAVGAMAFFYRSLNSWVLQADLGTSRALNSGTNADTCQNNFCHVEFPLISQLTFVVWVRGKTVTRCRRLLLDLGFAGNFFEVKVA
jgi:hypothetical protein